MDNDPLTPGKPKPGPVPPLSPVAAARVEQPAASATPSRVAPEPQSPPSAEQRQTPEVRLTAIPADGEQPMPIALEPDAHGVYRFALECLPGADAVHLLVELDQRPRLRAEVRARAGDLVRLELRIDETGETCEPVLRTGSHRVLFLPLEAEHGPLPPLPPPRPDAPWDICLLIDATMRHSTERTRNKTSSNEPKPKEPADASKDAPAAKQPDPIPRRELDAFLIEQSEPWAKVVAPIVELVRRLGETSEARLAVIAFADEPPTPGIYASDLVPRYHLEHLPDERQDYELLAMTPEALEALLLNDLTASPGMDFVDAVGDALAAAHGLQWRDDSRRLVILLGDSPGHSTIEPIRYGGDALARAHDIDTEAARLHQDHAEILTIYHPPSDGARSQAIRKHRDLFDYARNQYRRLASEPTLEFTSESFEPEQAITALQGRRVPLGRDACWGRLIGR